MVCSRSSKMYPYGSKSLGNRFHLLVYFLSLVFLHSLYNVIFFWVCLSVSVSSLVRESLKLSVTVCVLGSAGEALSSSAVFSFIHPICFGDEHNVSFYIILYNLESLNYLLLRVVY